MPSTRKTTSKSQSKKSGTTKSKMTKPTAKTKVVESAVDAASGEITANAEMKKVIENIRELQWSGNVRSAEEAYAVGEEVRKVEDDPKKYGLEPDQTPVEFLAKQLKCKKDTLYNAARVVKLFERQKFGSWLKRKGPRGNQLTFSHFVAAAKIADPKAREDALNEALQGNKSSRALLRAVTGKTAKKARSNSPALSPLAELIEASETALLEWQNIDGALAQEGDLTLRELDKASELQHQLCALFLKNAKALHLRREQLEAAAASKVPVDAEKSESVPVPAVLSASKIATAAAPAMEGVPTEAARGTSEVNITESGAEPAAGVGEAQLADRANLVVVEGARP